MTMKATSELRKVGIVTAFERLAEELCSVVSIGARSAHLAHSYAVLEAVYPFDQGRMRFREVVELVGDRLNLLP